MSSPLYIPLCPRIGIEIRICKAKLSLRFVRQLSPWESGAVASEQQDAERGGSVTRYRRSRRCTKYSRVGHHLAYWLTW